MGRGYYAGTLSAERLRECYDLAPPRVRRYLEAEIEHLLARTPPSARILELGCGYGRVLGALAACADFVLGIDSSFHSLRLARDLLCPVGNVRLATMDAGDLALRERGFDRTICVQNGISAFGLDPRRLLREALRVTRPGGLVLLSSYAARFWDDRLQWFEIQAAHGLIGAIDRSATRDGVIVCRDGFRATTIDEHGFRALAAACGVVPVIHEVDGSSLFCEIVAP
jgi:SAM-dependent methyltransferase